MANDYFRWPSGFLTIRHLYGKQGLAKMTDTRDSFVNVKPVIVADTPDAHQVWLDIGVQHFTVGEYCETKEDAEWHAAQLRIALTALQAGAGDGEDTARIDYLETLRGDMITGTSDDQELVGHDWVIYGQFYTVREALDYGMMKRQEAIDNAQATEGEC